MSDNFTPAQQQAIAATGNVLLVAGAGTGKTKTLVERCLNCLLDPKEPASLDELLMVTFTEAAAAEMRHRIRARLEELQRDEPTNPRWAEQLALFDTALIGTLHSFCFQLVREHFYELELDPQLTVLAEEEARLLADETMEEVMQRHYKGQQKATFAVQELIQAQGRGQDKPIRSLVLELHHYSQTLPNPGGWLQEQSQIFSADEPNLWKHWLLTAAQSWAENSRLILERLLQTNELADNCYPILKQLLDRVQKFEEQGTSPEERRRQMAESLKSICAVRALCPIGKKGAWLDPLDKFFAAAEFLSSLASLGKTDPLREDWNWVRGQMTTLLELVREFEQTFTNNKRELGMVDFHDLEQYALRLLWNPAQQQPTTAALDWQERLRFIFVDEYQDINAAQDQIIQALSRPAEGANRFLVGDIKQSIYGFRLANPYIFKRYIDDWRKGSGTVIPLTDNFRSQEGILDFVNSFFSQHMQDKTTGIVYDAEAQLKFGAREKRFALSNESLQAPCVEVHLRITGSPEAVGQTEEPHEAYAFLKDLENAEKEARLVGLRIQEILARPQRVWDEELNAFRPVKWSDVTILLRAPSGKAESYAKEFSRLNIPLLVERAGFYKSLEVMDLISLLQVLDNPLQDIPLLAVLRSPLVGLSLAELGSIRLATKGPFWSALLRWAQTEKSGGDGKVTGNEQITPGTKDPASAALSKVQIFLERFSNWRRVARQVSVSRCLDAVLSETHYDSWLLTQVRGERRHDNLQRLLRLAQQFDKFQRQGLFRFLCFVQAQQLAETEPDVPASKTNEDAVRLMSIHQSKGLEFPVVVLPDLSKSFNFASTRTDLIVDETYGLCPQIKPPGSGTRYPSLPYWLAKQVKHRELLSEELRLLYVAMTRARDMLILSSHVSPSRFQKRWSAENAHEDSASLEVKSYADWLARWFASNVGITDTSVKHGSTKLINWFIHDDSALAGREIRSPALSGATERLLSISPGTLDEVYEKAIWKYPQEAATNWPAKATVSSLRQRAADLADEASARVAWNKRAFSKMQPVASPGATAEEIGNAHHQFLQLVSLNRTGNAKQLTEEVKRLVKEGALSAEQSHLLNLKMLARFWESALGRRICEQAQFVKRELPFTARFSPAELSAITGESVASNMQQEFVVVQGVADLVVLLPEALWLLDFKTDRLEENQIPERAEHYAPQLRLYSSALSKIYKRPATGSWLYFLSPGKAVEIGTAATSLK